MHTWNLPCDRLGILSISSILPQILPQTSSQTQGNSRVSRMEHQTPSVFPGNFRERKVLGTLCFPFCFPENLVEPKRPDTKGELLELAAKRLNLSTPALRVFAEGGDEYDGDEDVVLIESDEIIYV